MLVLIPAYLSPEANVDEIAPVIRDYIRSIDHYFVENEKTARRIIKFLCPEKVQAELKLYLLDKDTVVSELSDAQDLLKSGVDFGVLSEAGMPCIADPGHIIVRWAHQHQIKVLPLTGPSSILLTLISSGFIGQQFTFHGYLPIDKSQRRAQILQMESVVNKAGYTQIFMETPYRNNALIEDLVKILSPETSLCIAANLTHPKSESIMTLKVKEWRKKKVDFHKIPAVFAIGRT